jgi:hypothetical protein
MGLSGMQVVLGIGSDGNVVSGDMGRVHVLETIGVWVVLATDR